MPLQVVVPMTDLVRSRTYVLSAIYVPAISVLRTEVQRILVWKQPSACRCGVTSLSKGSG